jgi:ABC-2 type transport system ATP-binding protein
LDPTARAALWQSIQELASAGLTVLLTTHHLEEADYLASTVAIMNQGRIVVQGTPHDLKADLAGDALEVTFDRPPSDRRLIDCLGAIQAFRELQIEENELRVRTDSGANSAPTLLLALANIGIKVRSLRISSPSLEDVYKRHTGLRFPTAG